MKEGTERGFVCESVEVMYECVSLKRVVLAEMLSYRFC